MKRIEVGGPWFEDFKVGQVFDDAPAVTVDPGTAAIHRAAFGDRLRLPIDGPLSTLVTGRAAPLANPTLVCNIAIGATTGASQRVRANLFYRRVVLARPVFIGDTLRVRSEVVGLKENARKPGRPPTGLVALRVRVEDQDGHRVLDFWRCPMIPLRDPAVRTGHADALDGIPAEIDEATLLAAVPEGWRLDRFRQRVPGPHLADMEEGVTLVVGARDTVTAAPEIARMTLNLAAAHTDAAASPYGRRLVYGGHTVALAAAQATRAIPTLVTILAWRSCDHTGPVFEGDVLRTEVTVERLHPTERGGGLVDLRAATFAERALARGEEQVLDWRFVGLMA